MKIETLKAEYGDCFIISDKNKDGRNINILVDGGTRKVYRSQLKPALKEKLEKNKECLDVIIVTHIDDDHIGGIIELFNDKEFLKKLKPKKIIYNFFELKDYLNNDGNFISYTQGDTLSKLILEFNNENKEKIEVLRAISKNHFTFGKMNIDVISPLQENIHKLNEQWEKNRNKISCKRDDYDIDMESFEFNNKSTPSLVNTSSICFIIRSVNRTILMMGDSPADLVYDVLKDKYDEKNPLKLSLVKLSHHGGENSVSENFLNIIECNNFLISTNGKRDKHPRKKTLVEIFRHNKNAKFLLNYERGVFSQKEIEKYNINYYEDISSIDLEGEEYNHG